MTTFIKYSIAAALCAALLPAAHASTQVFREQDRAAVRAVFLAQAAAATGHDLRAFDAVLARPIAGQADPVAFVARAYQFWGRPALLAHFQETFKGVWKFEPDVAQIRIQPLSADVAQIYAPTRITLGKNSADARTSQFLVYETAIRTPAGWRIGSIIPVPAQ
jgi:ketosteroid isomerase-like protein